MSLVEVKAVTAAGYMPLVSRRLAAQSASLPVSAVEEAVTKIGSGRVAQAR